MELVETILAHESHINTVRFAPNGTLVSAGMDNLVKVWSSKDWSLKKTMVGHENSANSIAFSPNGKLLATSSTDTTVRLWQWPSGKPKQLLKGHKKPTIGARFSPDGKLLASNSYDDRIKIWSIKSGDCLQDFRTGKRRFAFTFVGDEQIISAGETGKIIFWNAITGAVEKEIDCPADYIGAFVPSANGKLIAFADYSGGIYALETKTWQMAYQFRVDGKGVFPLSFSPNSKLLGVGWDHHIALFDLKTNKDKYREKIKPKGVYSLDFSADGSILAVGAADKRIRIWRT